MQSVYKGLRYLKHPKYGGKYIQVYKTYIKPNKSLNRTWTPLRSVHAGQVAYKL